MHIDSLNEKFFDNYREFLLKQNKGLAKEVWSINSERISSTKLSKSSSIDAYNFWIFSLNLINLDLEENIKNEDKVWFYSNIICDWKPDYSFDAIYIPDDWNVQIYDFKSGRQGLDFNDIETFKNFFIKHIEESQRTNPDNPILIELLEKLDKKIVSDNVKIDIYIIRERNIDDYYHFENQLNELRWKTKKVKIWNISIIDWNKINDILRNNLMKISNYSTSFYDLKIEHILWLEDWSNIVVTSLYELLCFYLNTVKNNYDIFKLNVRKEVDKNVIRWNIIETIEVFPEKFFRFHNGINLTYEQIKINKNNLEFQFPQIINWCQTMSLLQNKFLKYIKIYLNINCGKDFNKEIWLEEVIRNIEKLKTAKILIKVHKAKVLDWDIDKIAEYSNNQNPINKENLRANDLVQVIIEQFISKLWYKYIRKEWELKDWSYIDIWTLFQLLHTCLFEVPNWSKNNKNQIFTFDNSKYSYLSILENIYLEDIEQIINIYFRYLDYKEQKFSLWSDVSDYYDHHIILALFYMYKNWICNPSIYDEFDNIYNLINGILGSKDRRTAFLRHFLQIKWMIVWRQLKYKLLNAYPITIKFCIWDIEYNLTELEKYKLDRLIEKEKNKKSKLWNITSVIRKVVSHNNWIKVEDLFEILSNFYSNFWWEDIKSDKFKNDIEDSLGKNFKQEDNLIYIK